MIINQLLTLKYDKSFFFLGIRVNVWNQKGVFSAIYFTINSLLKLLEQIKNRTISLAFLH